MKHVKVIAYVALLTMTISSTALAGTIVGARANRTGTIVGARSGNIAGTRTGNIVRASTGNVDSSLARRANAEPQIGLSSVLLESIDTLLGIFLTRTLF
jgi:hypothetical protein